MLDQIVGPLAEVLAHYIVDVDGVVRGGRQATRDKLADLTARAAADKLVDSTIAAARDR